MTAEAVSGLRTMLSLEDADPGLLETIGELSVTSDGSAPYGRGALSGLDQRPNPTQSSASPKARAELREMILPQTRELFIVCHAAPGSPTAERLQLLASP